MFHHRLVGQSIDCLLNKAFLMPEQMARERPARPRKQHLAQSHPQCRLAAIGLKTTAARVEESQGAIGLNGSCTGTNEGYSVVVQ